MTIGKETARLTAKVIIRTIKDLKDEPPHLVALGVIESLQAVAGNKSFRESLQLVHRELKDIMIRKEEAT